MVSSSAVTIVLQFDYGDICDVLLWCTGGWCRCRLWILQAWSEDKNGEQCRVHDEREFQSRLRKVSGNAGDKVQVEGLRQVAFYVPVS